MSPYGMLACVSGIASLVPLVMAMVRMFAPIGPEGERVTRNNVAFFLSCTMMLMLLALVLSVMGDVAWAGRP